jgi:hypothetical protein
MNIKSTLRFALTGIALIGSIATLAVTPTYADKGGPKTGQVSDDETKEPKGTETPGDKGDKKEKKDKKENKDSKQKRNRRQRGRKPGVTVTVTPAAARR